MFVDRIYFPVTTLGPGERVVVWTCGCTKRCPGCANPELWETRPEAAIEPARLAAVLNDLAGRTGAHRITFTGGDPLEQAPALASVLAAIRSAFDDILIYTGYTFGELTAMPKLPKGLLPLPSSPQPSSGGLPNEGSAGAAPSAHPEDAPLIDVLIDGPYVEAENDGVCALRGSTNQRSSCSIRHWKPCIMRRCRNRARCRTRCSTAGRYPSASTAGPKRPARRSSPVNMPTWQRELENFIGIKPLFVLEGNVSDL